MDLNVAQSALLAGLVQAPNVYDPTVNPELARERRGIVLGTMLRDGKIVTQARQLGCKKPFMGADGWAGIIGGEQDYASDTRHKLLASDPTVGYHILGM